MSLLILAGRTGHNHTMSPAPGARAKPAAKRKTTTLPGHSGMIHAMETPAETMKFTREMPKAAREQLGAAAAEFAPAFLGTAQLAAPAVLEHETHGHILLPAGNYVFLAQQEVDPFTGRRANVFD